MRRRRRHRENKWSCFNTASGMRSIAILTTKIYRHGTGKFQYRKRYEVYCNNTNNVFRWQAILFQYRKRYEVYCNMNTDKLYFEAAITFQYRKRYEVYCN